MHPPARRAMSKRCLMVIWLCCVANRPLDHRRKKTVTIFFWKHKRKPYPGDEITRKKGSHYGTDSGAAVFLWGVGNDYSTFRFQAWLSKCIFIRKVSVMSIQSTEFEGVKRYWLAPIMGQNSVRFLLSCCCALPPLILAAYPAPGWSLDIV